MNSLILVIFIAILILVLYRLNTQPQKKQPVQTFYIPPGTVAGGTLGGMSCLPYECRLGGGSSPMWNPESGNPWLPSDNGY